MNKENILVRTIDEVKVVSGGKSEFEKVVDFLKKQIVLIENVGLNGEKGELKKGKLVMWGKRVLRIEKDNREYRILKIYSGLKKLNNSKSFIVLNDEGEVLKVIKRLIEICEEKGDLSFLIK